jgi:hypothetical protein
MRLYYEPQSRPSESATPSLSAQHGLFCKAVRPQRPCGKGACRGRKEETPQALPDDGSLLVTRSDARDP